MVKQKTAYKIKNRSVSSRILTGLNSVVLLFATLLCLFPILNIFATSLSSQAAVSANRVTFFPVEFTLASYQTVLHRAAFWSAAWISVKRVIVGIIINVVIIFWFTVFIFLIPFGLWCFLALLKSSMLSL